MSDIGKSLSNLFDQSAKHILENQKLREEVTRLNLQNSELRAALWLIWRDPTNADVQHATLQLLENLDKSEKRNDQAPHSGQALHSQLGWVCTDACHPEKRKCAKCKTGDATENFAVCEKCYKDPLDG